MAELRIDPAYDGRRLVVFFGVTTLAAMFAVFATSPQIDVEPPPDLLLMLLYAPAVGAVVVAYIGPAVVRVGWPSGWVLAGLVPPAAALMVTTMAGLLGVVGFHSEHLGRMLAYAVPFTLIGAALAFGEEVGWRGFLWPLLRRRTSFWISALVLAPAWWATHALLVLVGWYGSVDGLPAYTVGLVGFVLFAGVLTDRSRSIWPAVVAHGAWNGTVALSFSATGDEENLVFSGSDALLGAFGWLAATSMLLVGLAYAGWHVYGPDPRGGREETGPR
ncbi:CPBP family intramembrane glutamic endopeptidase [Mumia flava]|nr:CPBP family intramembrane glutamic endopeptidase [Mumia flava]